MGIRAFKPTSAARRFYNVSDFADITTRRAGTRAWSRSTSPRPAGVTTTGASRRVSAAAATSSRYRVIDFKRNKIGVPARVAHIEYDPNRTARIALLHYADGEKRYILAPDGLKQGDTVVSSRFARHHSRQLPAARGDPGRHDDSQHRGQEGQGRPVRALGRRRSPADVEGRRPTLRSSCRAAKCGRCTSPAAPRSARSRTSNTRTSASARPVAAVGSAAPAQPRRHHEPRRSPDGWW